MQGLPERAEIRRTGRLGWTWSIRDLKTKVGDTEDVSGEQEAAP